MFSTTGILFTKQTDVLPQDLVKSRSCEILKFDRRIDGTAAVTPVKFQSNRIILNLYLAPLRFHEIWLKYVLSLSD